MASVTIPNSATVILPRNVSRKSFSIQNEDGTDIVYVKREEGEALTVSATDHDFRIGPGSSLALTLNEDGSQQVGGRWTGIASANTPRISFFETEDVVR
jgi:hypothetical protein